MQFVFAPASISIFGPFALGRSVASAGLKIPLYSSDNKAIPTLRAHLYYPSKALRHPRLFFSIFAATTTDDIFLASYRLCRFFVVCYHFISIRYTDFIIWVVICRKFLFDNLFLPTRTISTSSSFICSYSRLDRPYRSIVTTHCIYYNLHLSSDYFTSVITRLNFPLNTCSYLPL